MAELLYTDKSGASLDQTTKDQSVAYSVKFDISALKQRHVSA